MDARERDVLLLLLLLLLIAAGRILEGTTTATVIDGHTATTEGTVQLLHLLLLLLVVVLVLGQGESHWGRYWVRGSGVHLPAVSKAQDVWVQHQCCCALIIYVFE